MSRLSRNANPEDIVGTSRVFFVTTKTTRGKRLLRSERNANLLIDILRANVVAKKFHLHDFVVMPDHAHLLLSINRDTTIEKTMQLIKGGFSYRLNKEFGYSGDVWQRGFADDRILNRAGFLRHREYIQQNPVRAGLVTSAGNYPFSFLYLSRQRVAGAKAQSWLEHSGTTEVVPFHKAGEAPAELVPFHKAKEVDREDVAEIREDCVAPHD